MTTHTTTDPTLLNNPSTVPGSARVRAAAEIALVPGNGDASETRGVHDRPKARICPGLGRQEKKRKKEKQRRRASNGDERATAATIGGRLDCSITDRHGPLSIGPHQRKLESFDRDSSWFQFTPFYGCMSSVLSGDRVVVTTL